MKTSFCVALLDGKVQRDGISGTSLRINVDALPENIDMCFEEKRVKPINANFEDVLHLQMLF